MKYAEQRLKNIKAVSASSFVGFSEPVLYRGEKGEPIMLAVTQDFLLTSGRQLLQGRFFSDADFTNYRRVTVIDKFLADKLFQGEDPIGELIYIRGNTPFLVVGVVESKSREGQEPKGALVMPMSIHSAMTGNQDISMMSIRPENENTINAECG